MSSRAKLMLEMVHRNQNKNEQHLLLEQRSKEIRAVNTRTTRTASTSKGKPQKEIIDGNVFDPAVLDETASNILNGFNFDLGDIINKLENIYELKKDTIKTNNEDISDFESCDDSLEDPNFLPPHSKGSTSETETDENISQMALQIENALDNNDTSLDIKSKRNRKKINRNLGKSYTTVKGKVIPERKFERIENCQKKCKEKISDEQQKQLFDHYWALGSYNQRILYISSFIDIVEKKTQKLKKSLVSPRNRANTMVYYVILNSQKQIVCQKCFRKCFGETESFIKSVIKKKISSPDSPFTDHRGKFEPHNKLTEEHIEAIKDHINSFPAYESHYSRRHTSIRYLHADLSISKMHGLYCEQSDRPVSLSKYLRVFKGMNLKFKSPSIDTCNRCDILKCKIDAADPISEEKTNLIAEQKQHHMEADLAYKAKDADKMKAKTNATSKTYTFDLQQCLPTPHIQTSVSFYKRQLYTYNLTIHDCASNEAFCYMWHEAIGARGGNNIASCLFKHLKCLGSNINSVTLYSDSCVGQNKNSYVAAMFLMFIENCDNIHTIDHKFLIPGHTHMECDVDHSVIERKKKKTSVKIHHPRDWYQFVRSAGTKQIFKVIEMQVNDFYDFCAIVKNKFMWRGISKTCEKFIWKDVKWLRYTKGNFGILSYKNSLNDDEPFKELNIRRRGIRSVTHHDLEIEDFDQCISVEKKNDLIAMLPLIDPCFHEFYKNLKTRDMLNIHPDLVEED